MEQHEPGRAIWHLLLAPVLVTLSLFASSYGYDQVFAAINVFVIFSTIYALSGVPIALRAVLMTLITGLVSNAPFSFPIISICALNN